MNKVKNTIVKSAELIKKHVDDHRYAIMGTLAITTVAAITLQQANVTSFYAFLEKKGIDPMEYHTPEYYAELNG